jgi:hypothetical protein
MDDNMIKLVGTLNETPIFSHESHEVKFYRLTLRVSRLSGAEDVIHVQAPQTLLDGFSLPDNPTLCIIGHLRSFNNKSGVGNKLVLSVLARDIRPADSDDEHSNSLKITGTLCKEPTYRKTPLGREICDLLIAVSRYHGRSDYLPCIAWGAYARAGADFHIGDRVGIKGRLQSREYIKIENGIETTKTAFEISASEITAITEANSAFE